MVYHLLLFAKVGRYITVHLMGGGGGGRPLLWRGEGSRILRIVEEEGGNWEGAEMEGEEGGVDICI